MNDQYQQYLSLASKQLLFFFDYDVKIKPTAASRCLRRRWHSNRRRRSYGFEAVEAVGDSGGLRQKHVDIRRPVREDHGIALLAHLLVHVDILPVQSRVQRSVT